MAAVEDLVVAMAASRALDCELDPRRPVHIGHLKIRHAFSVHQCMNGHEMCVVA